MSDLGHEQTDKELKRIENLISKEYSQAAQELEDKMKRHFADFDRKDAEMKKKLDAGVITEKQYNEWRVAQIAVGDRWREVRDSMVDTLVQTDKAAVSIIQGNSIKAYGDNMNYGTYEVEHNSKINTGFSLYDFDTVNNLLKEDPGIVPMPKIDIPKDELWNRQKLSSAVLQGVLQGDSISGIADRLSQVASMDESAAIRNARTYTTAAENKGRLDSYERANNLGIQTKKKWIATLDDRTRAEHRHLDGMVVDNDDVFKTDGFEIAFPGDPNAEPEMFYNCRCTLVAEIVGYDYKDERNDSKLGDMDYEEWKHAKDKESQEEGETKEEREKRELAAVHQYQQVSWEGISNDEKDSLNDFINDNEDVTEQVSRGMIVDQSQIDKWLKDGEISMGEMSSWTTDGTTAAEFANVNRKVDAEDGKRSVIIISENGLPDSALLPRTNAYSESEVLTSTDKYTIVSSEVKDSIGDNKSPTVTIIHVEPKDEFLAETESAAPAVEVPTIIFNRYTDDNEKAVRAMYADQVSKYSTDEKNGIRRYVGDTNSTKYEYEKINGFLRNGGKISKANEEAINSIDKAIENFEVKEPFTARRGVDYDAFYSLIPGFNDNTTLDEMKEALVGSEFVDKGYMSASWNVWHGFSRDVYLEVDVPAGKGYGCMVGNLPRDTKVTEDEFILKRNTHVEFYDVTIDKYQRIILHSKIVED